MTNNDMNSNSQKTITYTPNEFIQEVKDMLKGYYIDYEVEDIKDTYGFFFKLDCEGAIIIGKNNTNFGLTFEDGNAFLSFYTDKNSADRCLFNISSILKAKIKACNYKGMH